MGCSIFLKWNTQKLNKKYLNPDNAEHEWYEKSIDPDQLIRIHAISDTACKYMLLTGMLQFDKTWSGL